LSRASGLRRALAKRRPIANGDDALRLRLIEAALDFVCGLRPKG
jgi:hypothetical protein